MGICCSTRDGHSRPRPRVKAISNKSLVALTNLAKKTKEMETMVENIITAGKPWTDKDFPPRSSSLYDPNIDKVD